MFLRQHQHDSLLSINQISKIRLITDTGVGYWDRWVKKFKIDVSSRGTQAEDFITVYSGEKQIGDWESFYFSPVVAKYIKITLLESNNYPSDYLQLGELEVYKTTETVILPPSAPGKPYAESPVMNILDVPILWEPAIDNEKEIIDYHVIILDANADNALLFDEWIGNALEFVFQAEDEQQLLVKVQAKNSEELIGPWSAFSDPVTIQRLPLVLSLVESSPAHPSDNWTHAIDGDFEGWEGTVSAVPNSETGVYAIFCPAFGETFHIDRVKLMSDTKVGYEDRWVKHFKIQYSITGLNNDDFQTIVYADKQSGGWASFSFSEIEAKYIKLIIEQPDQTNADYIQLGEFQVFGNIEILETEKAELTFLSGSVTWPGEDWTNAIDGDIEGAAGTLNATFRSKVYGIYSFADSSTNMISKIRLLTDTGIAYWDRWVSDFRIDVSVNSLNEDNFITVCKTQKKIGGWETFYFNPVPAKYVKLVLLRSNTYPNEYFQLGEFELYKQILTTPGEFNLIGLNYHKNSNIQIVQLPTDFKIDQNYPNPFNPETTIKYQLPDDSRVSLVIFNMLGQKVINLVDERKPAGYHVVKWNGCDYQGRKLASGIYFYKFRAGEYNLVRKMILME